MSFKKALIGMLGLPPMLLATCPDAHADIWIGVDHSFGTVMAELMTEFMADHPDYIDKVHAKVSDSAPLKDEILNSGAKVSLDLFISPNSDPSDLYNKYQFDQPKLAVYEPFQIATDSVVLYSGWMKNKDISAGFPMDQDFMLADPVTDPYGAVSAGLLAKLAPSAKSRATMLSHAKIASGIGSAWAAVEFFPDAPAFGFVAKSNVCDGFGGWLPGSYHYEFPSDIGVSNEIKITGVAIKKKRTPEDKAELDAFVEFLQGKDQYAAHRELVLKGYCYVPST